MVATPKHGKFTFVGLVTGRTYIKDVYFSDVANALARFDSGAGANSASDTFYLVNEPCTLADVSIITGMADTTQFQLVRNSINTGDIIGYVEHVSSNANRPRLAIPFGIGDKVGAIQLA